MGAGALVFEAFRGRTSVTTARASSPLKLLLPRNHGSARWSFASTYGGGLVDGDDVRLDVRVAEGAKALVGTQASTKIYRGTSRQTLDAEVGADALLVVMPDPVTPFAGARYEQQANVRVHPRASLVWVEALSCGRAARGERWAFARYATRTRLTIGDALAADDALVLDSSEQDIPRAMGRFDALATMLFVGFEPSAAEQPGVIHAGSKREWGTCVRVAAESTGALMAFVRATLGGVREALGDDPFARKW